MAQAAASIAQSYSEELVVPDFMAHPSQITDPKFMGHLMNVSKIMKGWCASVEHHAKQMALKDNICPEGYELKHKSGRREIKDAVAAYGSVMTVLKPEEFMEACTVSIAKLEKVYGDKAQRGKKKAAREQLQEDLADIGVLNTGDDVPYLGKVKAD